MLFSEIYGSYYNAVAEILKYAVRGELTDRAIYDIVRGKAFSESVISIPEALKSEAWPLLLLKDNSTPLEHVPTEPLSGLQKRWLKSLLSDPRIKLFAPSEKGLENIRPLFSPDVFVCFDRYSDGDQYDDPTYIEHFRIILKALREKRKLLIRFTGSSGKVHSWVCVPEKLEYSSKDDKFRLITFSPHNALTINLSRIDFCKLLKEYTPDEYAPKELPKRELTLELSDERNALERVMLHFSHLEKETQRIDKKHYRIKLKYYSDDETELLIRVLSFGPMVKVTAPEDFVAAVRERIEKQMKVRT